MTTPQLQTNSQNAELAAVFQEQRFAFRRQPYPSADERRNHLDMLCSLLLENRNAIADAISCDFGHRSSHETQILEIMPAVRGAKHARVQVAKWMRPERKSVSV